ncbi:MAG TPA: flippase-like domain-containing protein, partial [Candidatus Methylomirabilis sp.]|nr:flippase-like domain-containing protein [Candidatus Methylomirabilis sp.]
EADIRTLDQTLREFYDRGAWGFLVCSALHFLGWMLGCFEVYGVLWMLGSPLAFPVALAVEALAGVAKLAAAIVPGSLGVQEGGQVVLFVAFNLGAPLAMTFSLLRRGRELLWIGFGLAVLVRRHGWAWFRRDGRGEGK